ncbi:MAG: pentapeptide repeat-containing protein [Sphaerospermopsis kisseleviana]
MELTHARGTLLAEPRSRSLLLSGSAPGADLQGLNLRGAYLPEADLRRADLRDTNLSEAVLAGAQLEGANLKASQCLGTNLAGAHLTGATLEGWNIDHTTKLEGVDCAYVYLLEPFDAHGQRLDDHHRERLPHDPDKTFGPGDFETYFKQMIEEVKLLIKNGVDFQAFQQAYQEVMRQHPQITPESLTGIRRIGNDVLVTLQPSAPVDKGAVEQTLSAEYSLKLENARLQAQLEGAQRVGEVERQRAEDHRNHAAQLVELFGRPMPPAIPATAPANVTIAPVISPVMGNHSGPAQPPAVSTTTIQAGDGNLINPGTLHTGGGAMNLGDLSEQARLTIEALPDQRPAAGEPSLRELLLQLKASVDADTQLPEATRAEALAEVNELAVAARDPQAKGGLARRAMNALKGLTTGLSETNQALAESSKLVGAVKRLWPLLVAFFPG